MAQHMDLGRQGEDLAAQHLYGLGFTLLHRNWRYAHLEIDIIATKNGMLHFVEVKLRSSPDFGPPEAHVNRKKFMYLARAAEAFLHQNKGYRYICFDILAINLSRGKKEFFLIEDVFM